MAFVELRPLIIPKGQIIFRLLLLKSHIFDNSTYSWKNKINFERFIFSNSTDENLNKFTEFLTNDVAMSIVRKGIDIHKGDKRKVTGDPYLKHLIYSTYLGFISPEFQNYDESNKRIIFTANLLHDSIEIKRKSNPKYSEKELYEELNSTNLTKDEKRKVVILVSLLTPPKNTWQLDEDWLQQKLLNFKKILGTQWHDVFEKDYEIFFQILGKDKFKRLNKADYIILAEMTKEIKMDDEAANVRETVDDIKHGKDNKKTITNGIKPLYLRFVDFTNRFKSIRLFFENGHSLKAQLKEDLGFIYKYLNNKEH